jgi:hypothetical protein
LRTPPAPDDWRRQDQARFLKRRSVALRGWSAHRDGWDHDHCEFCGAKFSMREGDLNRGYTTADDHHWICETCFADFAEEMQWEVE